MNSPNPETEARAVVREFRETAWDLTRDVASLTWRVPLEHYKARRRGMAGDPPDGPLTAAAKVAFHEALKTAGGMPCYAVPHWWAMPVGLALSNVVLNTALAKNFWLDNTQPILPRHEARQRARAALFKPYRG